MTIKKTLTASMLLLGCCAALPFAARSQRSSKEELFKATPLTPAHSFLKDVEGPAVDRYGNLYAVNYQRKGTIAKVSPSGAAVVYVTLPEGSVGNGIRFDSHGNMYVADYTAHNVLKIEPDTKAISVLAHEPSMHQPNDLAIDKRDRIYASDPDFNSGTGRLWRVDPNGTLTLLDSTSGGSANGLEVNPDENILYVNGGQKIWAFDLKEGNISNKRVLIEFPDFGVDGMRCDVKGNIYIARFGKGVVAKISPDGKVLKEIILSGKQATNVAFGGKDGRTVFVTLMDQGNIEMFRADEPGREFKMLRSK